MDSKNTWLVDIVRARLLDARRVVYVTSLGVVLIGMLTVFDVQQSRVEYEQVSTEAIKLQRIIYNADHIIQEIRRYLHHHQDEIISEERRVQTLILSTRRVGTIAQSMTTQILDSNIPQSQVERILHILTPYRELAETMRYQSIDRPLPLVHTFDTLQAYPLSDLATLADYASIDPFRTEHALSDTSQELEHSYIGDAISSLEKQIRNAHSISENENLPKLSNWGKELRKRLEAYSLEPEPHSFGGLSGSLQEIVLRAQTINSRKNTLRRELTMGTKISIPWIEEEVAIQNLAILLPASTIAGFGIVTMLLSFSCRKLATLSATEKQQASDIGFVFTQLAKQGRKDAILAHVALILLLGSPIVMAIVVRHVSLGKDDELHLLASEHYNWKTVVRDAAIFLSFLVAISCFIASNAIAKVAAGNPIRYQISSRLGLLGAYVQSVFGSIWKRLRFLFRRRSSRTK